MPFSIRDVPLADASNPWDLVPQRPVHLPPTARPGILIQAHLLSQFMRGTPLELIAKSLF